MKGVGAFLIAALLAGCAAAAPEPAVHTRAAAPLHAAPDAAERSRPAASAGPSDWALAIIGTPFVFAFRVVTCAATAVVAAPTSGLLLLTPDPKPGLGYLRDGLGQNCGPPYGVPVPVAAGYRSEPYMGYYSERTLDYHPEPSVPSYPSPGARYSPAPDVGQPRPLTPYR
jgi:hypothetical protein